MRLLRESDFRDGASNMAVDSAILEAVADGSQPPTLRLYGWSPFCLSLGYGQRIRDVDMDALEEKGWDLVRRPTGGKAILHGDELTYSLTLPLGHPLASGDVVESYRRISGGLLAALEGLGVSALASHREGNASGVDVGPVCFEMPSHYEITVDGRKLVGSAQLRRRGGMLQHGTIPLDGDVARICDALAFDSVETRQMQKHSVRERAVTLSQVKGRVVSWPDLASALEQGFRRAFDLEMLPGKLSDSEHERAIELKTERFANADWTSKR